MGVFKSNYIGEIDPDNCTKEELAEAIQKLQNLSGYYETKQLALKTFINSVYGATASKFFVGHNTDVAESITLQGQDLNHYSENCVNKYFRGIFQSDEHFNKVIYVPIIDYAEKWPLENTELYAKNDKKEWVLVTIDIPFDIIKTRTYDDATKLKLKKVFVKTVFGPYLGITHEQAKSIDINRGRVTEQKPLNHIQFAASFKYLDKPSFLEDDPTVSMTIAGDTDSCEGSTKIYVDGKETTIADAFTSIKYENKDIVLKLENGQEILPVNGHTTRAFNASAPLLPIESNIKYFMRHKVSKGKFKIKSKSGKEVIVTEDHSCMVIRDNKLIEVKAKDINIKTDRLVELVD